MPLLSPVNTSLNPWAIVSYTKNPGPMMSGIIRQEKLIWMILNESSIFANSNWFHWNVYGLLPILHHFFRLLFSTPPFEALASLILTFVYVFWSINSINILKLRPKTIFWKPGKRKGKLIRWKNFRLYFDILFLQCSVFNNCRKSLRFVAKNCLFAFSGIIWIKSRFIKSIKRISNPAKKWFLL